MPLFFMRSYAGSTGWVISTFVGWFNFDPMTQVDESEKQLRLALI